MKITLTETDILWRNIMLKRTRWWWWSTQANAITYKRLNNKMSEIYMQNTFKMKNSGSTTQSVYS